MKKINLIYINFEFPPLNKAGINRALNFIRFLDKEKYNIKVICFSETALKTLFTEKDIDNNLLKQIPPEVEILQIISAQDLYLFSSFTFNKIFKNRLLKNRVSNIIDTLNLGLNENNIIITSIPYFGAAFLGLSLKFKLKSKLILDLRDEWSHFPTLIYKSYLHYLKKFFEEKFVLKNADAIITVSRPLRSRYLTRHNLNAKKIYYLPNSFEIGSSKKKEMTSNDTIKIGYTGSFYYNPKINKIIKTPFYKRSLSEWLLYSPLNEDWTYRTPFYLFKLIKELQNKTSFHSKIEVHLIGDIDFWLQEMINELNLEHCIKLYGKLNKESVYDVQKKWDAFLITSENVHNEFHYCIPSKIFDYLSYDIPIIALVTNGPIRDIVESANCGIVINPLNLENELNNFENFLRTIKNWKSDVNTDFLVEFDSRNTGKKLDNIIQTIK